MKGLLVALVVGVLLGVSCNGVRGDEIACESAVGHLRDCCPNFTDRTLNCEFSNETNCEGTDVHNDHSPDLYESESACLRGKSCDELQLDLCAKLVAHELHTCR